MTQNLTETKITGFRKYKKTEQIKAKQMTEAFIIDTLEGTFIGKTGDWLVEGIEGERWIIDAAIFKKTYAEVV